MDDVSARCAVLLIEAHPWLREVFAHALADEGYEVAQAGDGDSALLLARRRAPAAIVLDPREFDQSIEEFFGQLRANEATHNLSVVLLRADDEAAPPDLERTLSQVAAVLGTSRGTV